MRLIAASTTFVFALALASPAIADGNVAPVKQGEVASFTGLLVSEKRFIELLEAEVAAKRLKMELDSERRFTLNLEDMYKNKLLEAAKPPSWYETTSFNRWFGFTIGVAITGFALWGATEVVKASGNGK